MRLSRGIDNPALINNNNEDKEPVPRVQNVSPSSEKLKFLEEDKASRIIDPNISFFPPETVTRRMSFLQRTITDNRFEFVIFLWTNFYAP